MKTKTFIDIKVTRNPKPTKNNTRPYLNEIPTHFIHKIKTKGYDVIGVNLFLRTLMRFLRKKVETVVRPILLTLQGYLTIQTVSMTIWWQVFLGWSLTTLPRLRKQALWRHGPRNVTWCLGWIFQNCFSEICFIIILWNPLLGSFCVINKDLCIPCGFFFLTFQPIP